MPTKRRRRARPIAALITLEAAEAYARGDWHALFHAINQRPWETSPLDVDAGPPPAWMISGPGKSDQAVAAWQKAQELRAALEMALVDFDLDIPDQPEDA